MNFCVICREESNDKNTVHLNKINGICGHSFCADCVKHTIDTKKQDYYEEDVTDYSFVCPMCRTEHDLTINKKYTPKYRNLLILLTITSMLNISITNVYFDIYRIGSIMYNSYGLSWMMGVFMLYSTVGLYGVYGAYKDLIFVREEYYVTIFGQVAGVTLSLFILSTPVVSTSILWIFIYKLVAILISSVCFIGYAYLRRKYKFLRFHKIIKFQDEFNSFKLNGKIYKI